MSKIAIRDPPLERVRQVGDDTQGFFIGPDTTKAHRLTFGRLQGFWKRGPHQAPRPRAFLFLRTAAAAVAHPIPSPSSSNGRHA
jgi:hypothetical protein